MANFHSAKKLIVVSDKTGHTISILKNILIFCQRENYAVASVGEPVPEDMQPSVLLLCDAEHVAAAHSFAACVADYGFSAMPQVAALNPLTYSTVSDNADFTARNIRETPDGYIAFEVIGVGVIGRARLATGSMESIGFALAAAAAAIACGIPFAEVLDALNSIQIED